MMNNPFDYIPDAECNAAYKELLEYIDSLRVSHSDEAACFLNELERGKMLGVLVAKDRAGVKHKLYAFSGQLGNGGFYFPGFVEPTFDYLKANGHFKIHEAEISRLNQEIRKFEDDTIIKLKAELERIEAEERGEVQNFKQKCRLSKMARDARRSTGEADALELEAMLEQSRFEKAELHRMKKRMQCALEPYKSQLEKAHRELDSMKQIRRGKSEALQKWLFSNFMLLNGSGEQKSLSDIFAETEQGTPPYGAGECCGPKLLQAAYRRKWLPISMAEYWYGRSGGGEVRRHGEYYPACRGKCLPVLRWMLKGVKVDGELDLDSDSRRKYEPRIVFENQYFCVVDKPSGMLSVPGKTGGLSLQEWLMQRYDNNRQLKMAHRLDRDTSGLIIATFSDDAYRVMQKLFASRCISKTYVAILEGDYRLKSLNKSGLIELPLSADMLDRPRQRVDMKSGKPAVTEYEFQDVNNVRSRVILHPLTGRTHQLRVHAAAENGLGIPIVGDRLYGINVGGKEHRLHLHACTLSFIFPLDNQKYCFESIAPF